MGMGRAQNGGMERAGPDAEIVDETATAGQQGRVLDALHRLSRP
jgi:hypothetical protein